MMMASVTRTSKRVTQESSLAVLLDGDIVGEICNTSTGKMHRA